MLLVDGPLRGTVVTMDSDREPYVHRVRQGRHGSDQVAYRACALSVLGHVLWIGVCEAAIRTDIEDLAWDALVSGRAAGVSLPLPFRCDHGNSLAPCPHGCHDRTDGRHSVSLGVTALCQGCDQVYWTALPHVHPELAEQPPEAAHAGELR